MNYERYLNPDIAAVPPSGIRRFFDLAANMRDAISLGVGEPDFITPYHIRNAAINSIVDGETQYTPNRGLLSLRKEISWYLEHRYQTPYDPEKEILVTVGASESIDVALRAIVSPGDEVLVPEPSYVSYSPSVIFAGGRPVGVVTGQDNGFRLTAAFDVDPVLVGTRLGGGPVYHVDMLESYMQERRISVGVLTVPASVALESARRLAACGVEGIWNFTNVELPEQELTDVQVENVHFADSLLTLSYMISEDQP